MKSTEIVELLLEYDASVNMLSDNLPPLATAIQNHDTKMALLLLNAGANSQIPITTPKTRWLNRWSATDKGMSLLELAQIYQDTEVISRLTHEDNKTKELLKIKLGLACGILREYKAENSSIMKTEVNDILNSILSILEKSKTNNSKQMTSEIINLRKRIQNTFTFRLGALSFLSTSSVDPNLVRLKNTLIEMIDLPDNVVKEKYTQRHQP